MTYDTTTHGLKYPQPGESVQLWTHFQQLAESVETWLKGYPAATITKSDTTNLAVSGTLYNITYDGSVANSRADMIDLANDRILVPVAGLYEVEASVGFGSNGTGYRAAQLYWHDTVGAAETIIGAAYLPTNAAGSGTYFGVKSRFVNAVPGDYFYVKQAQLSGGALLTSATFPNWLSARLVKVPN
jgi:hypothetical protein